MAEFCTCGSLMIQGACSNKNCSFHKAKEKKAKKISSSNDGKATLKKELKKESKKEPGNKTEGTKKKKSQVVTYSLSEYYERKKQEEDS